MNEKVMILITLSEKKILANKTTLLFSFIVKNVEHKIRK